MKSLRLLESLSNGNNTTIIIYNDNFNAPKWNIILQKVNKTPRRNK